MWKALAGGAALLCAGAALAQDAALFPEHQDVGQVSTPGTFTALPDGWRMSASGANIWGTADAMHYAFTRRSGEDRKSVV